jgi:peptidoglycan/LPS O-acetylase OafA/YrhL
MTHGDRVQHLDGIRGVAILAVLSVHWLSWYSPFFHGGAIGVDMFFVLSGFIITTVLWRTKNSSSAFRTWITFIHRRSKRLYPALLGLVFGSALLYGLAPSAPISVDEVLRRGAVCLAQGSAFWAASQGGELWLPALHPFAQTWSLAIEWYFYLLWPIILLRCRAAGQAADQLAKTCLIAAAGMYALSLPLPAFWFYFGPSARFAELLVGSALALRLCSPNVPEPTRLTQYMPRASMVALSALVAYTLLAPSALSPVFRFLGAPLGVGATVLLISSGYSNQRGVLRTLLISRRLTTIGRYSYSLYLWHIVPMLLMQGSWLSIPVPLRGVIAVAATITLTILSYQLLELPFLRPRGDALKPGRPKSVTT